MSENDVSDAAVEAAIEAYSALPARTTFHESMRAAIAAAMPILLSEVGYVYNIFGDPSDFALRDLSIHEDVQKMKIGEKVYRIRPQEPTK